MVYCVDADFKSTYITTPFVIPASALPNEYVKRGKIPSVYSILAFIIVPFAVCFPFQSLPFLNVLLLSHRLILFHLIHSRRNNIKKCVCY